MNKKEIIKKLEDNNIKYEFTEDKLILDNGLATFNIEYKDNNSIKCLFCTYKKLNEYFCEVDSLSYDIKNINDLDNLINEYNFVNKFGFTKEEIKDIAEELNVDFTEGDVDLFIGVKKALFFGFKKYYFFEKYVFYEDFYKKSNERINIVGIKEHIINEYKILYDNVFKQIEEEKAKLKDCTNEEKKKDLEFYVQVDMKDKKRYKEALKRLGVDIETNDKEILTDSFKISFHDSYNIFGFLFKNNISLIDLEDFCNTNQEIQILKQAQDILNNIEDKLKNK